VGKEGKKGGGRGKGGTIKRRNIPSSEEKEKKGEGYSALKIGLATPRMLKCLKSNAPEEERGKSNRAKPSSPLYIIRRKKEERESGFFILSFWPYHQKVMKREEIRALAVVAQPGAGGKGDRLSYKGPR